MRAAPMWNACIVGGASADPAPAAMGCILMVAGGTPRADTPTRAIHKHLGANVQARCQCAAHAFIIISAAAQKDDRRGAAPQYRRGPGLPDDGVKALPGGLHGDPLTRRRAAADREVDR